MSAANNLPAALDLAAAGWEIFPCEPVDVPEKGIEAKEPATVNGHLVATTDRDQIEHWWGERPHYLIGLRVPENMIVLDNDPRNGGKLSALPPLPRTLTSWSGRGDGGCHKFFTRPEGKLTSSRLPKGIDLKTHSGYVIAPPSLHPATGQPYRWEHATVALLPYAVVEMLRPKPRPAYTGPVSGSGKGLINYVRNAKPGERHNALLWACFRAQESGILDKIADALESASIESGHDEKDARSTVESVVGS
jgi:hypothetical protein